MLATNYEASLKRKAVGKSVFKSSTWTFGRKCNLTHATADLSLNYRKHGRKANVLPTLN